MAAFVYIATLLLSQSTIAIAQSFSSENKLQDVSALLEKICNHNDLNGSRITLRSDDGSRVLKAGISGKEFYLNSSNILLRNPTYGWNMDKSISLFSREGKVFAFFPKTGIITNYGSLNSAQFAFLLGTPQDRMKVLQAVASKIDIYKHPDRFEMVISTDPKLMERAGILSLIDPTSNYAQDFITRYSFQFDFNGKLLSIKEEHCGLTLIYSVDIQKLTSQNIKILLNKSPDQAFISTHLLPEKPFSEQVEDEEIILNPKRFFR